MNRTKPDTSTNRVATMEPPARPALLDAVVDRTERAVQLGVLRADSAPDLLASATAIATPLAQMIRDRKLSRRIRNREYVFCEGWTTLAAMLGVTPHEVEVTEHDGIFVGLIELRTLSDGRVVSRASAECGADDEFDNFGKPIWSVRPRYARRSMALTRATAKACRLAFSWIMVLAGYEGTPAEEVPNETDDAPPEATDKQLDEIAKLIAAPLITDAERQRIEKRLGNGMTADQAQKAVDWLHDIIAQRDAEKPDGDLTQKLEKSVEQVVERNKPALAAARKVYAAAVRKQRPDLDYDDAALAQWETATMGRPSSVDWTATELLRAADALTKGEGPHPDGPPEDAAA